MTATVPSSLRPSPVQLLNKLPRVGTTIFTVMSALATEKNAVNLGQGFPDFSCDPRLVDEVTRAMQAGLNQYPPMTGVATLRQGVGGESATETGRGAGDEPGFPRL